MKLTLGVDFIKHLGVNLLTLVCKLDLYTAKQQMLCKYKPRYLYKIKF